MGSRYRLLTFSRHLGTRREGKEEGPRPNVRTQQRSKPSQLPEVFFVSLTPTLWLSCVFLQEGQICPRHARLTMCVCTPFFIPNTRSVTVLAAAAREKNNEENLGSIRQGEIRTRFFLKGIWCWSRAKEFCTNITDVQSTSKTYTLIIE